MSPAGAQSDRENSTGYQPAHPVALRTMSSDIQVLLKTNPPSISQIITKQPIDFQAQARVFPKPRHQYGALFFFSIGLLMVVGAVAGVVWFLLPDGSFRASINQFPITPLPTPQTPQTARQNIPAPSPIPLFKTDTSRTITIPHNDRALFFKLTSDTLAEQEPPGTLKRILIKLQTNGGERFAGLEDFFDLWRITAPPRFFERMDPVFMFFIFYGANGPRAGFATRTHDQERAFSDILFWESSLVTELKPLFFDADIHVPDPYVFEDRAYRNIDWRYLKLSQEKDLGIGYMIFPAQRLVVFSTGKEAMEAMIKHLLDG